MRKSIAVLLFVKSLRTMHECATQTASAVRRRLHGVWPCMVAAAVMAACSGPDTPLPSEAPVPDGPAPQIVPLPEQAGITLEQLPRERVTLSESERDGYAVPAGVTRIDFEVDTSHSALRFAVSASEGRDVFLSVYQEGRGAALPPVRGGPSWCWRRTAIAGDAPVSLVLQSDAPFHLAAGGPVGDKASQPDVLIVLIDTLRQDHLGCYHYPLDTSPNIDRFAEDAVRFYAMVAMSSWTRPSVATLLTGLMDYTHHALSVEDHLRPGLPSLARTLEQDGWETHGITVNPVIGLEYGFGADFQWYEEVFSEKGETFADADADAVNRAVAAIEHARGRPLFLYLHLMSPHREYTPPPEYADLFMPDAFVGTRTQTRVMEDMALYNAEIRYSDDQFARVIQALKDAGRYEDALVVVLSDHGEQFMEHGDLAHGRSLHYHEILTPLIIKLPGNARAGGVVRPIVQMADVAPTLLEALAIAVPTVMEGRSLMPLITLEGLFSPKPAFARLRGSDRHLYMAQTLDVKYIYDVLLDQGFWYDLYQDPLELNPLLAAPDDDDALREFAEEQAAIPVPDPGAEAPALTDGQREQLEALGYL